MSQWLTQVIEQAQQVSDYLTPKRQQALLQLQQSGWPGRRDESWRFTPLTAVEKREANTEVVKEEASVPAIEGLDALDIVFVNGQLVTNIHDLTLPQGVTIADLAAPAESAQQTATDLFGSVKPRRHLFGLVNDTVAQQGLMIEVAPGAVVAPVIRIVNCVSADVDSHTRVLVKIGADARARVFEYGEGAVSSMTTAFAEYDIASSAHLEHYRFAFFTGKAKQVGGSHFKLGESSSLNSTIVGYGSELSRLDIDVWHAGEHANAKLNAVYLLAEGELFDLHTNIEHAVPHGTTEENARGIIGDGARGIFNGRIHIHRDAQKTLAELNNRNLLLSRRALIHTKPELEIYADDVKCAHGATVAEIAENELYYLLTRGISRSRALVMLNFGFIQELVNQIPDPAIAEWLLPKLSERFIHMEVK